MNNCCADAPGRRHYTLQDRLWHRQQRPMYKNDLTFYYYLTWLKDDALPLYYMATSLSPDTNVEWCRIKAQSDCYIKSNNCSEQTVKPHEVQLH